MNQKPIRTRFAPSPTGMLHIGGFRAALYAWLLARHSGGKFLLRIEDTDNERKVDGAIRYILEGFKWFGLDIDEGPTKAELETIGEELAGMPEMGGEFGPYIQSLRLPRYKEIADRLVAEGHAFRCDCTSEMLDRERAEQRARKEVPGYSGYCRTRNVPADKPHVVRFKMPHRPEVEIIDGIRGRIAWESVPLRDPILMKSDGFPTYHLAAMVDDHEMEITHVMRGEEWIPSTPLHVLLYRALKWDEPVFCHLPVVLGSDGKKLSKRHGSTSWSAFREEGYLPEALLNFIVRIGWSPGEGSDQEIFSREELIKLFSLEHVNTSSGVFEYPKLQWMNGMFIRNLSDSEFEARALPFIEKSDLNLADDSWRSLMPKLKERTRLLTEVPDMLRFLEEKPLEREIDQMLGKGMEWSGVLSVLDGALDLFESTDSFEPIALEKSTSELADKLALKKGSVFIALRIAVLGKKATPPLFESIQALGKDRTVARIKQARQLVEPLAA